MFSVPKIHSCPLISSTFPLRSASPPLVSELSSLDKHKLEQGSGVSLPRLTQLAFAGMQRAVVLVGSQKTLPIAVTVLNQLSAKLSGPIGLAVVPCVVAHLSQILIDSVLVSRWLRADAVSKPQKS